MSLCLKIRGPNGQISLLASPDQSWKDFTYLVKEQLTLRVPFDVLSGFPPVVHDHPDERPIGEFLSSNEVLRIQLKSSAGQQTQVVASPTKKTKKATPASRTTQEKPTIGFGAKIVSLKTSETTKSFLSKSPQKRALGEVNGTGAPTAKRRRRSSAAGKVSSEGDLAEHLISAVSGGTGTHNRAARKVFRNAVLHQYNSTQAVSRVNAIYSGNYTIRECGGVLLSSTSSSSTRPNVFTHIEVTYCKGAGSRGNHIDTVELLSKELLLGVLKVAVLGDNGDGQDADESKEVLKPMNLSKCSPRIFWSLVHHYGPNLIDNIRMVLKGVDDCAWLDDRKKLLSEKAMENLQQKEEQDAKRASKRGKKNPAEKIEPTVPQAIETPTKPGASAPVSASYTSEDPLTQNVLRHVQDTVQFEEIVPEEWRAALMTHLQVNPALAVLALAALDCSSKTRNALQALCGSSATLSLDQLESWIVSAQMQLFHAVWRWICGGGSERLRSALYKLRVRVPKHFWMWRNAPEGLLLGITELDGGLISEVAYSWSESADAAKDKTTALTAEKIAWMCQVAQAAQSLFVWIDDEQLHTMETTDTSAEAKKAEEDEEEGWQGNADAHAHLGKRARVLVENDYWEDGTVVAYLPPEPEEPMALWRVRVDAAKANAGRSVSSAVRERNEDLEEHEIEEALARLSE